MKNYNILITRTAFADIVIQADTQEEAEQKALELYEDGIIELDRGEERDIEIKTLSILD